MLTLAHYEVSTLEDVASYGTAQQWSLREALEDSAADGIIAGEQDTISFHPSLAGGTIALSSQLLVNSNVVIAALGAEELTIDANADATDPRRVFEIAFGATASFSGLTVTGGHVNGLGGGIYSLGDLSLNDVVVQGNFATDNGGGILHGNGAGSLKILRSTISNNATNGNGGGMAVNTVDSVVIRDSDISNNTANGEGGGIRLRGGTAGSYEISRSTIANNQILGDGADDLGGGILLDAVSNSVVNVGIYNSTISSNNSSDKGGGLYLKSTQALPTGHIEVTVINSTITANSAVTQGGGLMTSKTSDIATLHNTILADNASGSGYSDFDGSGTMEVTSSYNLFGNGDDQFAGENNAFLEPGQDTGLSILGNYGGPTQTHVPLSGSPAIDRGDDSEAVSILDQRGFARIVGSGDFDLDGSKVDIGAFEYSTDLTVTTLADDSVAPGKLSLRQALALANTIDGPDTITFANGLAGEILLTQGQLVINSEVTIEGPGSDRLTIDARGNSGVFKIESGATATLRGLRITSGNSTLGGGIYSLGSLTVDQSQIESNFASVQGGGIHQSGGSLLITNSTIDNNEGYYLGGGVSVSNASSAIIINSTISGNTATYNGGGVYVYSTPASMTNSTVTANSLSYAGGGTGIDLGAGSMLLHNTIVAGNINGADISANSSTGFYGSSYNLIGVADPSLYFGGAGNKVGTSAAPKVPLLDSLGDYGGQTQTHIPLPGSPAIDAGNNSWPETLNLETDQRGFNRLVFNVDIGAVEMLPPLLAIGDFNGDHRQDELRGDLLAGQLLAVLGTDEGDVHELWELPDFSVAWAWATISDLNGDGRDDIAIRKVSGEWTLAISDGAQFTILESSLATPNWTDIHVGDFDGDDAQELLGWNGVTSQWDILQYDDHAGLAIETGWGNALHGVGDIQVGDANRDGQDDLIVYNGTQWKVSLAQESSSASGIFAPAEDWGNWFGTYVPGTTVDADAPIQQVIDIFSEVHNNVELELYPGLMKGIEATEQTQAGNPWDQAALLVDKLETAGFEADIASGKVRASVTELIKWFGVDEQFLEWYNSLAAFNVIVQSFDANATPVDTAGNDVRDGTPANNALNILNYATAIEFEHAWVKVTVPTPMGLQPVDLDPSWKFKDRRPGIAVNLDDGHGTFDELDYLSLAEENSQLPLEFYEDQVMQHLVENYAGSSLADVATEGPIIQRVFDAIPAGLGEGVVSIDVPDIYNNWLTIKDDPALSHLVTISANRRTTLSPNLYNVTISPSTPLTSYTGLDHTGGAPAAISYTFESAADFVSYQGLDFGPVPPPQTVPTNSQTISQLAFYTPLDPPEVTEEYELSVDLRSMTFLPYYPLDNYTVTDIELPNTPLTVPGVTSNDPGTWNLVNDEAQITASGGNKSVVKAIQIAPYQIKPGTLLQFTFSSVGVGRLQGIGWSSSINGIAPEVNSQFLRTAGNKNASSLLPQLLTHDISDGNGGVLDGNDTYTVSIGELWDQAPNMATDTIKYLIFFVESGTDPITGKFSNIALGEDPETLTDPYRTINHSSTDNSLDLGFMSNPIPQYKTLEISSLPGQFGPYELTENTVLQFDFLSTYQGGIHAIGWDSDSVAGNGDSSSSQLFQIFGTEEFGNQSFADSYSSSDIGLLKTISIPIGQFVNIAAGGHIDLSQLVFVNDDGNYIQGGPVLYGNSTFRNITLIDRAYGHVESAIDQSLDSAIKLVGKAHKALDVSDYDPITQYSELQFTFRSQANGSSSSHYIGWDINSTFDNTTANTEFRYIVHGTGANANGPHPIYNGSHNDQTITIPIGQIFKQGGSPPINQILKWLTFGVDDGGMYSNADSVFSDIILRENRPAGDFQFVGNEVHLSGTSAKVTTHPSGVASNSVIRANSWLKFTFESDSQGVIHEIGWDNNAVAGDSPAGELEARYPVYGTSANSNGNYTLYSGSGNQEFMAIPVGRLAFNGGDPPVDQFFHRLSFTVADDAAGAPAESVFSNVSLWRPSLTAPIKTNGTITLGGTSAKTIDIPLYNVNSNTYLSFKFKSDVQGQVHGIGIDNDTSFDESDSSQLMFQLYGTAHKFPSEGMYFGNGQEQFYTIPIGQYYSGNANNIVLFNENDPLHESANSIFSDIRLYDEVGPIGQLWSQTLSVPQYSLDAIQLEMVPAGTNRYSSQLVVGGQVQQNSGNAIWADYSDKAEITVTHQSPTKFVLGGPAAGAFTYTQAYDEIIALGLDANQYSRESLAEMQAALLATLESNTTEQNYLDDIDDLLSFTVAKYWNDFNRDNAAINDLTQTIGVQKYVGSGVAKAKKALLVATVEDPSTYLFDYLPYRIAPQDMGVDLPNGNHGSLNKVSGSLDQEAFQLTGFNGSALEHNIVETQIDAESISTMKGLRNAYYRDLGLASDHTPITDDSILVFERKTTGEIVYQGEWHNGRALPGLNQATTQSNVFTMLAHHMPLNGGANNVATAIWTALISPPVAGQVQVLVPKGKSKVGNWVGSVYVIETPGSKLFSIVEENGSPTSGGFSGNDVKPLNTELPQTSFKYQTYAGDPVNVANGSMFRDDEDIVFPNLGVPLGFTRHYDSNSDDDIGMGVGWVYSFGDVLFVDPGDENDLDLVWLTSSGQRHKFEWDISAGEYKVPAALHGEFSYDAISCIYKDKSGLEYHFEAVTFPQNNLEVRGRLKKVIDNIGNGVEVVYEGTATHQIDNVHDVHTPERRLEFDYNANGVISQIRKVDANSTVGTWDYTYDTFTGTDASTTQRLTSAIAPPVSAVDVTGMESTVLPTVAYDYYGTGPSNGVMEKITEPDGGFHTYEYFPNGRVFRVKDSLSNAQTFNYNLFRNLTEFTDENGNTETYIHQDNGLLSRQIHEDRTRQIYTWGEPDTSAEFLMASSTDEVGATQTFTYFVDDDATYFEDPARAYVVVDGDFRLRELYESTSPHYVDAAGDPLPTEDVITTRFDYSQPAPKPHIINLKQIVVDPGEADITTSSTHDNSGRLLTTTDDLGNVTRRTYYAEDGSFQGGLLRSEISPRGNDFGAAGAVNGEFVFWEELTNVTITGDTISVRVAVDSSVAAGQQLVADAVRIDRVDGQFPLTKIIDDDNDSTDGQFSTTGLVAYMSGLANYYEGDRTYLDSVGETATWTFTGLEPGTYRVSATWYPAGFHWHEVPYEVAQSASFTGATVTVVNQETIPNDFGAGFETVFTYDAAGNVIQAVTDGLPAFSNTYDYNGNLLTSEDPAGVVSNFAYDVLGRQLRAQLYPDASSALALTSTFAYDAGSRVRLSTDPLGRVTEFQYDAKGNLVKQLHADGSFVTFEYDDFGNLTSQTDELDRTTRFVYDSRNQLIQTIHPDGASERVRYNGVGQVSVSFDALEHETQFAYDAARRLVSTTNAASYTATNEYDLLGRLVASIDYKNQRTELKYDDLGRVVETRVLPSPSNPTAPLVALSTTDYDAAGNVVRVASYDTIGLALTTSTVPADPRSLITQANLLSNLVQVVETSYDNLNRPVESFLRNGTTAPSVRTVYDNAGRLLYQYDELGRKSELRYDEYGRLSEIVAPDPDGPFALTSPITRFEYDAAGNRTAVIDPRNNQTEFEYDVFNRVVTTTDALGSQQRAVYDVAGQLVATVDALGRAAYTLYDNRGRTKRVYSPDPDGIAGSSLQPPVSSLEYDVAGNLIRQTDPQGFETRYEYDELNRLLREEYTVSTIIDDGDAGFSIIRSTPPDDSQANGFEGDSQFVHFDDDNATPNAIAAWKFENLEPGTYRLLSTWDADPAATTNMSAVVWDSIGQHVFNALDDRNQQIAPDDVVRSDFGQIRGWAEIMSNVEIAELGNTVTVWLRSQQLENLIADAVRLERVVTREYSYDFNGNLASETDTLGRTTNYSYDELNRVKTTTLPDPDGVVGAGLPSPVSSLTYDGYGNVIRTVEERGGQNRTTEWTYDSRNRLLSETFDAGGSAEVSTEYQYDAVGNLTQQIDAEGAINAITKFQYDDLNRLSRELRYRSEADSNPTDTLFAYDSNGNMKAAWTRVNHPVLVYPFHDVIDGFTYDALNRRVSATRDSGGSLQATSYTEYDAVGNVVAETDPLGRTTTSEYDRLNRLVKIIAPDPDGADSIQPSVSSLAYDVVGNLVAQTNGEGETEQFEYDELGRLVSSQDGLGHETRFTYDSEGNRLTYTDPNGNVTRYAYDELNRLTAETITLPTVGDVSRTYKYDAQGNLAETIDRNGRQRTFLYDRLDRQKTEVWYVTGSPVHVLAWQYDKLGRVLSHTDDGTGYTNVEVFEYDHLGRLTKQISGDAEAGLPFVEQRRQYDVLTFDDSDTYVRTNYSQYTTTDGVTYDPIGSTTYFTDKLGRTAKIVDNANSANGITDKTIAFTYDAADQFQGIARTADGGAFRFDTDYDYDQAGRVTEIAHRRPAVSGTPFTAYLFHYDQADRIDLQLTVHDQSLAAFSQVNPTQWGQFAYDEAGQLTTLDSTVAGQDESFAYDANGNRQTSTANGTTVVGAYNRLLEDDDWTYTYDNEGNLTRREKKETNGGEYTEYTWDHRSRLVRIDDFFSTTTTSVIYRYNADDQLVYRRLESVTSPVPPNYDPVVSEEYFTYNGVDRVLTLDAEGDLRRRYVHGPLTDQVLFDEAFDDLGQETDLFALAGDHLQTTRAVLDKTAQIVQSLDYDSFGEISDLRDENGQPTIPFQNVVSLLSTITYAGRFWDEDAELYINRARFYDPASGRFLGEDPAAEGSNWYRYAGNDPVNFRDPTGLSQAGNPLNNLFGGTLGGSSFSGPVAPSYSANQLFGGVNNITANRPAATLGPARPASVSPANIGATEHVRNQAEYDRKYGITPSAPANTGITLQYDNSFNYLDAPNNPIPRQGVSISQFPIQERLAFEETFRIQGEQHRAAQAAAAARVAQGPGPVISGSTREEADLSRLRYLQSQVNSLRSMTPENRAEYEQLSLAYAGPLDRLNITVGALGGFAGGYVPPGGTLNVRGPQNNVRLSAAPSNNVVGDLRISASRYPELAENIRHAQAAGHPRVLTHGGNTAANRRAALGGVPKIPGRTRDEYPFASSLEGGAGAFVGHIPPSQQSAQGAIIKNFVQQYGIRPGDLYRVIIDP